ncbi:MAG: ABC transporter substrate-binding protein [Pseudomonadota bacterium]
MRARSPRGRPLHPAIAPLAADLRSGRLGRREFLSLATTLGLAGTLPGALRAASHSAAGGTLRCEMAVHELTEPRLFQWPQMANQTRGLLEYLVRYERNGSFTPVLLESWDVSEAADTYVLNIRPGVRWTNGDTLTARHVAANFEAWCDTSVAGNSMPSRLGSLVDPETGQIRSGALNILDDTTLSLTLTAPDITLIAGLADYPAALMHPTAIGTNPLVTRIGTGPYMPDEITPRERSVWVRNTAHTWWNEGNGAALDRVEFLDFGTDPAAIYAAARDGAVDMVYETTAAFVDFMDNLDMVRSDIDTAATIVCRTNAKAEIDGARPYADPRVRKALQMAVDNTICLEIGHATRGTVAQNHHVAPLHPAYADIPAEPPNPAGARALMESAGMSEFVHELISLDDGWERDTTDAVAAQLRDAGFQVDRRVLPGNAYWRDWQSFPFSSTTWNQRPLGIQVPLLAYHSDGAWNETGFSNGELDGLLVEARGISDVDTRRSQMARIQEILQGEGVIIQPFWRTLSNHAAPDVQGADMHPMFEIEYSLISRSP